MKENSGEKQVGSGSLMLAHYFGNYIGMIRLHLSDEPELIDKEELKSLLGKFIEGVEGGLMKITQGDLKIDGVDINDIQSILDTAKSISDPSDPVQIKKLYDQYESISEKIPGLDFSKYRKQ